jgi:ABC-type antimicrobial peptide transport system ATPase subunit
MTYAVRHDEAVIGHQGAAVRQTHVGLLADRDQQVLAHSLSVVQAERAVLAHALILRFACIVQG